MKYITEFNLNILMRLCTRLAELMTWILTSLQSDVTGGYDSLLWHNVQQSLI
jgi:hypothetical protein